MGKDNKKIKETILKYKNKKKRAVANAILEDKLNIADEYTLLEIVKCNKAKEVFEYLNSYYHYDEDEYYDTSDRWE